MTEEPRVTLLPDLGIVEAVFSGLIPRHELMRLARESLALASTHGISRYLADCTDLDGGHSPADLLTIAEEIARGPARGGFREAVLVRATDSPNSEPSFWEIAARNRGLNVRLFTSRDEAIRWLAA